MTRQEMAALFARRVDAFNAHDPSALAALYAPDCVVESPLAASTLQGRQALTKVHESLFTAFPDIKWASEHLIIDGEMAAFTGTFSGTYSGGFFMGLPPNGKPIRIPVALICRLNDGLITWERRVYDLTGMLVQAGVLQARSA
jgi:steroid delta-isomerase-like uncharacterized protein